MKLVFGQSKKNKPNLSAKGERKRLVCPAERGPESSLCELALPTALWFWISKMLQNGEKDVEVVWGGVMLLTISQKVKIGGAF